MAGDSAYAEFPVAGGRLPYYDSQNDGPVILCLHPITGCAEVWAHQVKPFTQAGYRVVAYSRREHGNEAPAAMDSQTPLNDLLALLDLLQLEQVVMLGSGAGGGVAVDFTLSHPDRVSALILSCTLAGVQETEFAQTTKALLPKGFKSLPDSFQELGPAFRAEHPEGVREWEACAVKRRPQNPQTQNLITYAALSAITQPVMLMTGDADLYMPPVRLAQFVDRLPLWSYHVFGNCGHAAHWEQPQQFNQVVIEFLAKSGFSR